MKGVIFNVVEEVVREEHGEDAWDDLLADARLHGSYTSLGTYPDGDMAALVDAASATLGLSPADLLRHLGRRGFPLLAARNPHLMHGFGDTRALLLALDSVIHPEVLKLYPGAEVPEFDLLADTTDSVTLAYRSTRRLCYLAEGLALGVADRFGETVDIRQEVCQHTGADHCRLVVTWPGSRP